MLKKILALLMASIMLFVLAACGGNPPGGETGGTTENEEKDVPSFSVPTEGDPPSAYKGVNIADIVPDDCAELIYSEEVFNFKMSSEVTAETMIDFINAKLIPAISEIADNGACLVKEDSGGDFLGIGTGTQPYSTFDSFGYFEAEGIEYIDWIKDGEKLGKERQLSKSLMLLDVRYVYDGVLYNAITHAYPDEQRITVIFIEETNQNYEIIQ